MLSTFLSEIMTRFISMWTMGGEAVTEFKHGLLKKEQKTADMPYWRIDTHAYIHILPGLTWKLQCQNGSTRSDSLHMTARFKRPSALQ